MSGFLFILGAIWSEKLSISLCYYRVCCPHVILSQVWRQASSQSMKKGKEGCRAAPAQPEANQALRRRRVIG
ncbi:hypothetical protein F5Y19DRAFT_441358 [Xylariaceae sp. FL1651]|nr:hypothetical protein F5Y19DRAFT_441358 [Xylariaceae sp. FL1651]